MGLSSGPYSDSRAFNSLGQSDAGIIVKDSSEFPTLPPRCRNGDGSHGGSPLVRVSSGLFIRDGVFPERVDMFRTPTLRAVRCLTSISLFPFPFLFRCVSNRAASIFCLNFANELGWSVDLDNGEPVDPCPPIVLSEDRNIELVPDGRF